MELLLILILFIWNANQGGHIGRQRNAIKKLKDEIRHLEQVEANK